ASAITVERLSATVDGLRVRLGGVVNLSDRGSSAGASAEDAASGAPKRSAIPDIDFSGFRAIQPWLAFEASEEGGHEPPLLSASFVAGADGGGRSALEGTFGGAGVRWRGLDFARLSAVFRFDPATGELRLPAFLADYGEGSVAAALVVDTAARNLGIERLQSTVDP